MSHEQPEHDASVGNGLARITFWSTIGGLILWVALISYFVL